jgi:hypothetical protein
MKRRGAKLFSALWCASGVFACAPLTFSEPGAIDFERYRVARIEGDWAGYLAGELAASSGFAAVTTDVTARVDLVIHVTVSVLPDVVCTCEDPCQCNCVCEEEYDATAIYVATTPEGVLVDQGTENDGSGRADEAVEDALDQVALHYIRPYRL